MHKLLRRGPLVLAAVALLLVAVGTAAAASSSRKAKSRAAAAAVQENRKAKDRAPSNPVGDNGPTGGMQHSMPGGHLPGSSANVELIGELEPLVPFGPMEDGQIADLAVYKNTAYLNSWNEPTCTKGGFYSVDISNPRQPQQLAFEPALPGRYHGEGAHVITVDTQDVLR